MFCRSGLKTPIHTYSRPQNWGFWDLTPKMGTGINKTPERNILAQVCIVSSTSSKQFTCKLRGKKTAVRQLCQKQMKK